MRPRWMTAMALFCAATVAFLVWRDLWVPGPRDVEVWLGFELRGAAARWTAPLHWAVFALGAWGFWRARPWIVPAAAAYTFYVALGHVIWSGVSPHGFGWGPGVGLGLLFAIPGVLLLQAGRRWPPPELSQTRAASPDPPAARSRCGAGTRAGRAS